MRLPKIHQCVVVMLTGMVLMPAILWAQGSGEVAYEYQVESRTELHGQNLDTVIDDTVSVWVKGSMLRVDVPVAPGGHRRALIYRDGYKYLLDLDKKTALRFSPSEAAISAQQAPYRLDEYQSILASHGIQPRGSETVNGEDCYIYALPVGKVASRAASITHRVWIAKLTHRPVKEVVDSPAATTTMFYRGGKAAGPISAGLFAIPTDFKIVEMVQSRSSASAVNPKRNK